MEPEETSRENEVVLEILEIINHPLFSPATPVIQILLADTFLLLATLDLYSIFQKEWMVWLKYKYSKDTTVKNKLGLNITNSTVS